MCKAFKRLVETLKTHSRYFLYASWKKAKRKTLGKNQFMFVYIWLNGILTVYPIIKQWQIILLHERHLHLRYISGHHQQRNNGTENYTFSNEHTCITIPDHNHITFVSLIKCNYNRDTCIILTSRKRWICVNWRLQKGVKENSVRILSIKSVINICQKLHKKSLVV